MKVKFTARIFNFNGNDYTTKFTLEPNDEGCLIGNKEIQLEDIEFIEQGGGENVGVENFVILRGGLRPCPFCGGDVRIRDHGAMVYSIEHIYNTNCFLKFQTTAGKLSEREFGDLWGRPSK